MLITIDPAGAVAPFEQIRAQVTRLARSGELPAGLRLPTVRKLAGELGLAVNTVGRAYRELEADRVIETRGRNGTFIAASGTAAHQEAAAHAAEFAAHARRLGLTGGEAAEAALTAVRAAYHEPL